MGVVADLDVIAHLSTGAHLHTITELTGAGDHRVSDHKAVSPDQDVVRDVYEVVDPRARPDYRRSVAASVHATVRANVDVLVDLDAEPVRAVLVLTAR